MDAGSTIEHRSGELDTPELVLLQGHWTTIEGRRPAEFEIEGRRFQVRFLDGDVYTGLLDVVIDERPRTMLLTISEGPERHRGKIAMCIYELEGDTMRWCPAEPGDDDPPADFPPVDDRRFLCMVFQRTTLPGTNPESEPRPTLRSR